MCRYISKLRKCKNTSDMLFIERLSKMKNVVINRRNRKFKVEIFNLMCFNLQKLTINADSMNVVVWFALRN